MELEQYFSKFRKNIIGSDYFIEFDNDKKKMIYADWTASGRCYAPIEERLQKEIMPLVANTHSETSYSGMAMTYAYHSAQQIIKKHVNASSDDLIITSGSGMTKMINKLQRILNLKVNSKFQAQISDEERPVAFITHMEHHSNQTSWIETICYVEIIPPNEQGLPDLNAFKELVEKYKNRKIKIASITACSNVTGIITPYYEIARIIHEVGGYCFVDFACSAPYVKIDMHPPDKNTCLDAVLFSPHKFLGGPGTTGVLVFNKKLYNRDVPDDPGGGTVDWTNPWGEHKYVNDIEAREDGGTPAFLQTIKAAMCVTLKEQMGIENILKREHEILDLLWQHIADIPNLHILASEQKDRLAIISFYIDDLHYNLCVRLLNDKFGIQSRGGCSCAGTYGHYLLHVTKEKSKTITDLINKGDFSEKPGWTRISLHPTMTNEEILFIANAIKELAHSHKEWSKNYHLDLKCNHLTTSDSTIDIRLKKQMAESLTRGF